MLQVLCISPRGGGGYSLTWTTVFIRLSALGAYLIFRPSGWALIRGGRLFEAGRLLNFHHFQQGKGLFYNKTINNNKT